MGQSSFKSRTQEHNLPIQPTSFIGRASEVARIIELLADPDCRLLSLVGPGGIGKTRLAIQVASKLADEFSHGVHFVALHSTGSADFLAPTVANAINFSLRGQDEPFVQLLTHLANKEMLLVLDNFEHLLPPVGTSAETDSVALLTGILENAPAVKLLITSREALNLQGEWLFPMRGLPFPKRKWDDDAEAYGAVQLFVERARQVRPDFSLAKEQADVVRICQLVEGMPLAIEIAALWTKMRRCEDIAKEIEQNLRFLTTRLRDVPRRHRSLQVVFDQSWELLTETEQDIFKQSSVFRGGFDQKAAEEIAGASLPVLSALIDKSLLRWEPEERYQMHELLRQFAAERLQESPEVLAQVQKRHCTFYAYFLNEREEDMSGGGRQREATAEIKDELENIRATWQWAVEQVEIEAIQKSFYALSLFYQFQSRYREGAKVLEQAALGLDTQEVAGTRAAMLARVLVEQGWLYIRLGRLEKAETVLAQSQELYTRLDIAPPPGQATDPLLPLGIIATILGNYDRASALAEAARQRSEAHQHKENLSFAFYVLTRAALALGDYEAAKQYIQRAYTLVQETNDRWFMAYCQIEKGNVALMLGIYDQARHHYQAGYDLREAFGDPEGMAFALNHLGKLAARQQAYAKAKQLYQQSLDIYREINDQGGLARALNGLGTVACALENYQSARQYFQQALQIAHDIQFIPLILTILCGLGELLLQTGQAERGVELLAFTESHPASNQETKTRAQQRLSRHQTGLSLETLAAATERGRQSDLKTITAELLAEPIVPAMPDPLPESVEAQQSLSEPLTSRELEVLRLIAQGRTNQAIANELFIVVGTVKAHASNIYGKLNVNNRTEAVAKARELDLL